MPAVATLITNACTVHATDAGDAESVTDSEPRGSVHGIVPIPAWRGALVAWSLAGSAGLGPWMDMLSEQCARAGALASPEAFVAALSARLESDLERAGCAGPMRGLGIHVSAYERVEGEWIPELFLITNIADPLTASVAPEGMQWTRASYRAIAGQDHVRRLALPRTRQAVRRYLEAGGWLRFHHGDSVAYTGIAEYLTDAVLECGAALDAMTLERCRDLARLPLTVSATIERQLFGPERRRIGPWIHDLAVTPDGLYSSTREATRVAE